MAKLSESSRKLLLFGGILTGTIGLVLAILVVTSMIDLPGPIALLLMLTAIGCPSVPESNLMTTTPNTRFKTNLQTIDELVKVSFTSCKSPLTWNVVLDRTRKMNRKGRLKLILY